MPGTADLLALELGKLLKPLKDRLDAGETAELFAELGLPLPPTVANATAVVNASGAAAGVLVTLAARVSELATALATGTDNAIAERVTALLPVATDAFDKAETLATAVRTTYQGLGGVPAELQALLSELPERLLHHLVVGYLLGEHPRLARSLAVVGLIEAIPVPADGARPAHVRRRVRPDRLGTLFDDPVLLLAEIYGWGSTSAALGAGGGLDATLLLERLRDVVALLLPSSVLDPTVPALRTLLFDLFPVAGAPLPTPLQLDLALSTLQDVDLPLPLGSDRWTGRIKGQGSLATGAGLRIQPPARLLPVAPTGTVSGELTVSLERTGGADGPILVFGEADGTRLTAAALRAAVGAAFSPGAGASLVLDAEVVDGVLAVDFGGADGFLASVLPGASRLDFDTGIRWTAAEGISLRGGAALSVVVPLSVSLGPLRLDRLDVGLLPGPAGLGIEARVSGGVALGPFAAAVDRIGVGADLAFRDGNLGPVDLSFRFLPPTGLGLSIDAGPIRGGGFIAFDEPAGRYSGVLELTIGTIGITAIGLLDTKLPGGASGFALLVVLRGTFPPIQVGFGLALSSVGGLLALNRRIDVDALRARFASGTVGRILAPEDPVRNAPVLFADLSAVFPPTPGVVVVGPTLQLSWVEFVRVDIGLFLELPGPTKIVLLGSLRAAIDKPGGGRPLLQLRLDILGVLDFAKQTLEFDAVLVDSHLLEVLELSGGAAFRLSWGPEPYIVLSVGGFHPAYSPAPLTFPPSLTRIAMTSGSPTSLFYLRFEGYFAVTTNSLQFGASVEAAVNAGPLTARGFLAFDALIRFSPFYFQFDFRASFRVRFAGVTLAGVSIEGSLSGPGPITIRGKFCIEILFFEVCWSGSFSLGSSSKPAVTPVPSAVAELLGELQDPANLSIAEGGLDPWAVVAPPTAALPLPVVSPLGQVTWSQTRAPLQLLLQRFENAPLTTPETVTASGATVTAPAKDWFAPGSFAELDTSGALNRKAFERLDAGVHLGLGGVADGPSRPREVTVEQIRLPAEVSPTAFLFLVPGWLQTAIGARTGAPVLAPVVGAVAVSDEVWNVHGPAGGVTVAAVSESQAHQLAVAGVGAAAVPATDSIGSLAF